MWFVLICALTIPIVMLIGGGMMWKHCPKHMNGIVGYRTTRSMKNMDIWKFANEYCGQLWCKIGLFLTALSIIMLILFYRTENSTLNVISLILMAIQCLVLILSVFSTESALKKTFHEDGTRR